jgi:hypothetical protein
MYERLLFARKRHTYNYIILYLFLCRYHPNIVNKLAQI